MGISSVIMLLLPTTLKGIDEPKNTVDTNKNSSSILLVYAGKSKIIKTVRQPPRDSKTRL